MHPVLSIAREAVHARVLGHPYDPAPLAEPYRASRPLFVTLHEAQALRGCIGHLAPQHALLSTEIRVVAELAATRDPRFAPVTSVELAGLSYEVSLLGDTERVTHPGELDPLRYGVVVRAGHRRGVLLPDLPQVTTVEAQLDIARRKAGIAAGTPVVVERFEVEKIGEAA